MKHFKLFFIIFLPLSISNGNVNPLFYLDKRDDEIIQQICQLDDGDSNIKLQWDLLANNYYIHCESGNTSEDNIIFLIDMNKEGVNIYEKKNVTSVLRFFEEPLVSYYSSGSWFAYPFCESHKSTNHELVFITKIPLEESLSTYCYDVDEVKMNENDKLDLNSNNYKQIYNYISSEEEKQYLEQLNYYLFYIEQSDINSDVPTKTLVSYYINKYGLSKNQQHVYSKIEYEWLKKGYFHEADWLNKILKNLP